MFCYLLYIFILLKSKLICHSKSVHALYINSWETTHVIYCHTVENSRETYLIQDLHREYVKDADNSMRRKNNPV